jgi:hypothetical protein
MTEVSEKEKKSKSKRNKKNNPKCGEDPYIFMQHMAQALGTPSPMQSGCREPPDSIPT